MSLAKSVFEEEADPRVKWALELLTNDGMETTSILGYYAYPSIAALGTYGIQMIRKLHLRRPTYVGWPLTVGMVVGAWFAGVGLREIGTYKKTQEMAILEHYIRLHPDRFIEPETKKYGDKCVFYEWRRLR